VLDVVVANIPPLAVYPRSNRRETDLSTWMRFNGTSSPTVNCTLANTLSDGVSTTRNGPKRRPPGPKSVLVMDYVSWHRSPGVAALCRDRGVLLLYFPPCSGDFNPIEPYFEDLKKHLGCQKRSEASEGASEPAFVALLRECAFKVGQRTANVEEHFVAAKVPFKHRGIDRVDYRTEYADYLEQYLRTGTVQ